jgi:hypothetical protein
MRSFLTYGILLGLAVVFIAAAINDKQLRAYLQLNHPRTWQKFGFPDETFETADPRNEHHVVAAQLNFFASVRSGELRRLGDAQLDALLSRRSLLLRLSGALFLACVGAIFF